MTYRVKNITIAVALALVAALLTSFYVTNYQRNVRQDETNVPIWVAKRDIPAGTSGADIERKGMFEKTEIVRRSVVPGAISQPSQIDRLVAVEPIYAGEQISTRRFRTPQEQGIRAQLKGNLRAIQVAGTQSQLLGGTLEEGDRVDVVGTWLVPENSQNHISRVVLRDLLVLQAPGANDVPSKLSSNPNEPFAAMLAMTDSQAEKFWWVAQNGEWTLQLRPVTDATDSPDGLENAHSVAIEGVARGRNRAGGR